MTSYERQVYLLSPKTLAPETIAVTFAKTSRSPESFREIAAELTDEKSAQFHEKWVVGYGHSSVAEHAVLHIALENVSRLAIESIESGRLASYTEKSTRYQKWDARAFYLPTELAAHPLRPVYEEACCALFDTYAVSLEAVRALILEENPRKTGESDAAWERRTRAMYVDVCRFLLPAASLANVGVTANARILEHAIQKMLSAPLQEVRDIGGEMKAVAQAETPTLVKYAERVPYLVDSAAALSDAARELSADERGSWLRLVDCDESGEAIVLAAALYRFGGADFDACRAHVHALDEAGRLALAQKLLGGLGEHDIPLRELEHTDYTFDVTMDQGAYFEVKRHRMMTQTPQALTASLGYAVPRRMVSAGMGDEYRRAMDLAGAAYRRLADWNPDVAAYVVPNGYNRRLLMTLNLREAYHFCALRAAPNAHFSVRRVALRMAAEIFARHPALASFMRLPQGETWRSVEGEHFEKA